MMMMMGSWLHVGTSGRIIDGMVWRGCVVGSFPFHGLYGVSARCVYSIMVKLDSHAVYYDT